MKDIRIYMISAILILASSLPLAAQGWYAGVQGGLPFGVSTFSSFGADKTRAGYTAGVYGGYIFNPVLSLEAGAKWGQMNFSAKDCCIEHHLWLGSDGVRYHAPVLDMSGWDYADLKTAVFMQSYGLRLNVNLLAFFSETRDSRWRLEVSPLIAAVGTKATVKTIADGTLAMKGGSRWHFGAGGNLQAGYQLTKHLALGVYSGMTYLTGKRMDGMPEYRHKANHVWESGVRIAVSFGRKSRREIPDQVRNDVEEVRDDLKVLEEVEAVQEDVKAEEIAESVQNGTDEQRNVDEGREEDAAPCHSGIVPPSHPALDTESASQTPLPTIYFTFNSTRIRYSELPKVQQIRDMMFADPEMKIEVTGWCDPRGTETANRNISQWRAEAIKACLASYGISPERITAKGSGVDENASSDMAARRADSVSVKSEEE